MQDQPIRRTDPCSGHKDNIQPHHAASVTMVTTVRMMQNVYVSSDGEGRMRRIKRSHTSASSFFGLALCLRRKAISLLWIIRTFVWPGIIGRPHAERLEVRAQPTAPCLDKELLPHKHTHAYVWGMSWGLCARSVTAVQQHPPKKRAQRFSKHTIRRLTNSFVFASQY